MTDKKELQSVSFQAIFTKATTTVDGGWNVTFSLAEDQAHEIIMLAELRDQILQVAVVANPKEDTYF